MVSMLIAALLAAAPADPVAGRWEGSSLCQVRPSPCRDENVVYHAVAMGSGRYTVRMDKVVGGQEQEMGTLDAVFDAASGTLSAVTHDRAGRPGQWIFTVKGESIEGRLVIEGGQVYRLISVRRTP